MQAMHVITMVRTVGVAVALIGVGGCGEEDAVSEPIGPVWLEIGGGLCDGPCASAVVYRDGDEIQLHEEAGNGEVTHEAFGTLTQAGRDEFQAGSAEVAAALPQSFASCAAVDGQDIRVTLDDGATQWEEQFCASRDPEDPLLRVDAFLDGVLAALDSCNSTEHVDVHGC